MIGVSQRKIRLEIQRPLIYVIIMRDELLSEDFLAAMDHEPEPISGPETAWVLFDQTIHMLLEKSGFDERQRQFIDIMTCDMDIGLIVVVAFTLPKEFTEPYEIEDHRQIREFLHKIMSYRDLVNGFSADPAIEEEIFFTDDGEENEDGGQYINNVLIQYGLDGYIMSGTITDIINAFENYLSFEGLANIEEHDDVYSIKELPSFTQQCLNRAWGHKPN